MNKLIFLFPLLFMVLSTEAHSQERHLSVGGGFLTGSQVDEGYSPLLFSGAQGSFNLTYTKLDGAKENIWMLGYASGQTQNRFGRSLESTSVSLLALTLYQFDQESRFRWGWANSNQFNSRTPGGFQNYTGRSDYFTAFGPAMKYELPFRLLNQEFSFQTLSHLQLIGFYIPSGYVSSLPKGFGYDQDGFAASVYNSAFLFHPGSAVNLGLIPTLQWGLSDNSSLGLTYSYDYTSLQNVHPSKRSRGNYLLSLTMKL